MRRPSGGLTFAGFLFVLGMLGCWHSANTWQAYRRGESVTINGFRGSVRWLGATGKDVAVQAAAEGVAAVLLMATGLRRLLKDLP